MDVYECIRSRVAVRSFLPDPVPEPVIKKILRAGRWAPSRRNSQPWQFIVLQDRHTLKQLATLTSSGSFIADAPLAIAIVFEGARMAQFDAGRLIENMLLVAWSEGVGTCFVGGFDHEAVKEMLHIPQFMEFITAMPYGFPTDAAVSRGKTRKPLEELTHRERFGERGADV